MQNISANFILQKQCSGKNAKCTKSNIHLQYIFCSRCTGKMYYTRIIFDCKHCERCFLLNHSFHQRTCILIFHLDDYINITVLLVYMYCLENQCFGVYCVNLKISRQCLCWHDFKFQVFMHTYIAFLKGVLCIEEKKIPLVVTILILPYPKVMRGEGCQYASCMSSFTETGF